MSGFQSEYNRPPADSQYFYLLARLDNHLNFRIINSYLRCQTRFCCLTTKAQRREALKCVWPMPDTEL
ncbi:MAG TPA: hypothetical protein PKV71_21725, partial [Calditrichia bacterium]|nr:hypothetical protein [Calditrichia bacterium]